MRHLLHTRALLCVGVFVGGWAGEQLRLFWLAPIVGGVLGAVVYKFIGSER